MDTLGYFVDDGRTLDAYLQATPLIHPELRMTYRPTHVLDRANFHENTSRVGEKAITIAM